MVTTKYIMYKYGIWRSRSFLACEPGVRGTAGSGGMGESRWCAKTVCLLCRGNKLGHPTAPQDTTCSKVWCTEQRQSLVATPKTLGELRIEGNTCADHGSAELCI